jgi:hypothetical protein
MSSTRDSSGPFSDEPPGRSDPALPSKALREELTQKFRSLFPPLNRETFSDEILAKVFITPSTLPRFHENLLKALTQAKNVGSREQLYTVSSLYLIFSADPLRSSTGSLDYALFQKFVTLAVSDSRPSFGETALLDLFQAMEAGPHRGALTDLFEKFNYHQDLSLPKDLFPLFERWQTRPLEERQALNDYGPEESLHLMALAEELSEGSPSVSQKILKIFRQSRKSGFYSNEEIDRAIQTALKSPFGRVILKRILYILAAEDHPSKLREISDDSERIETHRWIAQQSEKGLTLEEISRALNGTYHTGYVEDLRVARKLVEVMQRVATYLEDPSRRERNFDTLEKSFYDFIRSQKELNPQTLTELLLQNSDPSSEFASQIGRLEPFIEVLSDQAFEEEARRWNQPEGIVAFIIPHPRLNNTYRLIFRGLPPLDLSSDPGEWKAFFEVMIRLKALPHEAQHWEDFTRDKDLIPGLSRHNRLVSEMLAYLAEFEWRGMNLENDFGEKAQRLGESPALHFRNFADGTYFKKVNEKLIRELLARP